MKRRGFLKGLAAALAVAPVVASQPAEASPAPPPDALESGYAMKRWIEERGGPVDEPITVGQWGEAERVALIERLRADPAVQEFLMRRVLDRLHQQYPPMLIRPQPTIATTDSANLTSFDWHPGQQYTYPGTIDPIPLPGPSAPWPFSWVDDG